MRKALRSLLLGVSNGMSRHWLSSLAGASLGTIIACGEPWAAQDTALEAGQSHQALAGYGTGEWAGPVLYWDQNNYQVPVCYLANPENTGSDAAYFSSFVAALAEVEEVAGLSFHWNGACANVPAGDLGSYMTVIFNDRWNSGITAPGFGKRRTNLDRFPVEYQVGLGTLGPRFENNCVHEVFHALGFLHEQQRSDSEATCAVAVDPNPNNTTVPGADLLTPYDPGSIMNYCRSDNSGKLTNLDRLGLSVIYPKTFTRQIQGNATFRTSNGLLTRTNGKLYSDWTAAGVLDSVIGTVVWTVSGAPVTSGPRLSLSSYGGTTKVMSGTFGDLLGRQQVLASTTVIIDNAKHTAVLMATL